MFGKSPNRSDNTFEMPDPAKPPDASVEKSPIRMLGTRLLMILGSFMVLLGLAAAAHLVLGPGDIPTLSAETNSPIQDCGAVPPASTGWKYGVVQDDAPFITEEQAISIARQWAGVKIDGTTQIVTRLVRFTDQNYTIGEGANAPLVFQNIDAYIVSFCNVNLVPHRSYNPNRTVNQPVVFNHEVNIVVSNEGEALARFTYR